MIINNWKVPKYKQYKEADYMNYHAAISLDVAPWNNSNDVKNISYILIISQLSKLPTVPTVHTDIEGI